MSMDTKDYLLIADAMREQCPTLNRKDIRWQYWQRTVHALATALVATSTRFDRAMFIVSCGAESDE